MPGIYRNRLKYNLQKNVEKNYESELMEEKFTREQHNIMLIGETIGALEAKKDYAFMVMGGYKGEGEIALSTSFCSTKEQAETYSTFLLDNHYYDYTKILETHSIKDTEGCFHYMVIGTDNFGGSDINTVRLFADRSTSDNYASTLNNSSVQYLVTTYGGILKLDL